MSREWGEGTSRHDLALKHYFEAESIFATRLVAATHNVIDVADAELMFRFFWGRMGVWPTQSLQSYLHDGINRILVELETHRYRRIVTVNAFDPECIALRSLARRMGLDLAVIERSPIGGIWLEFGEIFASSSLEADLTSPVEMLSCLQRKHSRTAIRHWKRNPSAFRSHSGTPQNRADVLLLGDNVVATRFSPLFPRPTSDMDAWGSFGDVAQSVSNWAKDRGQTLTVRLHPSDRLGRFEIAPILGESHVTLSARETSLAQTLRFARHVIGGQTQVLWPASVVVRGFVYSYTDSPLVRHGVIRKWEHLATDTRFTLQGSRGHRT